MKTATGESEEWFKLIEKMNELMREAMLNRRRTIVEHKEGLTSLSSAESRQLFREQLAEELHYFNQVPRLTTSELIMLDDLACHFGEVIQDYGRRPLVISTYERAVDEYVKARGSVVDEDLQYIVERFQALLGGNDQRAISIAVLGLAAAFFAVGAYIGEAAAAVYLYLTEDDDDKKKTLSIRREVIPGYVGDVADSFSVETIVQIAKRALALPEYQSLVCNYYPILRQNLQENLSAAKIFEDLLAYPSRQLSEQEAMPRVVPLVVVGIALILGAIVGFVKECAEGKTDKK